MISLKKIGLFIFILFLVSDLTAQHLQDQENKLKIDSLFSLIKKLTPNEHGAAYMAKLSPNNDDLEKAKKLMFDSYANTPIEFEKEFDNWHQEWGSTAIKGIKDPDGPSPGKRIWKIKESLAEKYSWDFVRFLETPYFMRVKILSITGSAYESFNKDHIKLPQVDMQAEIIEVIKGKNAFKEGDKITISYLPLWYSDCDCPVNFEINSEYVIPLKNWHYKNNKEHNELDIKNNGMEHFFKIENEKVSRPFVQDSNHQSTYTEFKSNFIEKYLNMGDK